MQFWQLCFFHQPIDWESHSSIIYYSFYKYGFYATNIFFMLSGMGIYFAFQKESLKTFYKRRLIRIIPYFYPIAIIGAILFYYLGKASKLDFITQLLMVEYWVTGSIRDWFISVALLFYIITPLIIPRLIKAPEKFLIISFLVCSIVVLFLYRDNFSLMVDHFPVYIMGIVIGQYIDKKKDIQLTTILLSTIIGIMLLAANFYFEQTEHIRMAYHTHYIPFTFLTLPFCLLFAKILSSFANYKYPILTFFGLHSLCLLIFHQRIMYVVDMLISNEWLALIITLSLTIIVSYTWQLLVSYILFKTWGYKLHNK